MDNELTAVIAEMKQDFSSPLNRNAGPPLAIVRNWVARLEAIAARSAREAKVLAAADAVKALRDSHDEGAYLAALDELVLAAYAKESDQ